MRDAASRLSVSLPLERALRTDRDRRTIGSEGKGLGFAFKARIARWATVPVAAVLGGLLAVGIAAVPAASGGNNTITLVSFLAAYDGDHTTNYTAHATNSSGDTIVFQWHLSGTCGSGVGPDTVNGQPSMDGTQYASYAYNHLDCPDAVEHATQLYLTMRDVKYGQAGYECTVLYQQGARDHDEPAVVQNYPPTTDHSCGGATTTTTTTSTTTTTTTTSVTPSTLTKKLAKGVSLIAAGNGGICGIFALISVEVPPVSAAALGLGAINIAVSNWMADVAADPRDPHFKTIAKPNTAPLLHVRAGPGISAGLALALNRFGANAGRIRGYGNAFVTSVNRAAGALRAHARRYVRLQLAAADRYAISTAKALEADPGLRSQLVTALGSQSQKQLSLSASRVQALRNQVAKSGLPGATLKTLKALGVSDALISQLRQGLIHVGAKAISITLASLVTSPATTSAEQGIARGLRQYASTH